MSFPIIFQNQIKSLIIILILGIFLLGWRKFSWIYEKHSFPSFGYIPLDLISLIRKHISNLEIWGFYVLDH